MLAEELGLTGYLCVPNNNNGQRLISVEEQQTFPRVKLYEVFCCENGAGGDNVKPLEAWANITQEKKIALSPPELENIKMMDANAQGPKTKKTRDSSLTTNSIFVANATNKRSKKRSKVNDVTHDDSSNDDRDPMESSTSGSNSETDQSRLTNKAHSMANGVTNGELFANDLSDECVSLAAANGDANVKEGVRNNNDDDLSHDDGIVPMDVEAVTTAIMDAPHQSSHKERETQSKLVGAISPLSGT
jgi:hypothetical protein